MHSLLLNNHVKTKQQVRPKVLSRSLSVRTKPVSSYLNKQSNTDSDSTSDSDFSGFCLFLKLSMTWAEVSWPFSAVFWFIIWDFEGDQVLSGERLQICSEIRFCSVTSVEGFDREIRIDRNFVFKIRVINFFFVIASNRLNANMIY